jgi:hypothetical protein
MADGSLVCHKTGMRPPGSCPNLSNARRPFQHPRTSTGDGVTVLSEGSVTSPDVKSVQDVLDQIKPSGNELILRQRRRRSPI